MARERQKVLGLLGDWEKNRFQIFRSLTLLRQLSLHAGLVDESKMDVAAAKVDFLVEQLPELVAEGHSALVFSQFTGFLAILRTPSGRRRGARTATWTVRRVPGSATTRSATSGRAATRCS